jgi:hypothetical protein
MNSKKEIERHRLPCGAVTIAIDGVCRKRLRDQFDNMLDELTKETHPEGILEEILETDQVDLPEEPEQEESDSEKKERMIKEGKMKVDVKKEVAKYEEQLNPTKKEPEETKTDKKKRMIDEGKFNNEVKHAVSKHMDKLQGNSKMLQDKSGKINKR